MIYMIGSCSYPATAKSPIDEDQMWAGYPQQESAAYAMAKKMGLVASAAYRQQYGLRSVILILGNVYGIYDNFREKEAHVIPALIHRFYKAKLSGAKQVIVWGSGKPERDFVYARDVAATLPFFIEKYNQDEPVNISSGTGTSIKSLAEMIKDLVGYRGEIIWDTSKPDGQMVKILDVRRMKSLGLSCPTTLYNGLKETINWFSKNYATRGDGIRL
jgi:GDP-L-fucose synthase